MPEKSSQSGSETIKDSLWKVFKIVAVALLGIVLLENLSRSKDE